MERIGGETASWVPTSSTQNQHTHLELEQHEEDNETWTYLATDEEEEVEEQEQQEVPSFLKKKKQNKMVKKKKKSQVFLEGYVEASSDEADHHPVRTKSLTDEDLDELKGCLDLGFGFSYDEIPELCNTLPALELCYSMSQKFLDDKSPERSPDSVTSPIASWKISSPGDHPEDVKARLKFWAQAVACTVRLCS